MAGKAKRGRPKSPTSKSAAPFSLRLRPSLKKELQRAADAVPHSLSEEIHQRLQGAMDNHDPGMRDVLYLIEQVGLWCRGDEASVTESPFAFKAFKVGVAALLEKLTPPGEVVAPDFSLQPAVLREAFKTPEGMGATVADLVFSLIQFYPQSDNRVSPRHKYSMARRRFGIERNPAPLQGWLFQAQDRRSLADLGKPTVTTVTAEKDDSKEG